jgi:hypothetical protein
MQVDVTMKAGKHSSDIPSIPTYLDLFPAAKAVLHTEDGQAALVGGRDVAVPQVQQAKQQESREVTLTDLEDQESGAGAKEEDDLMENSPQAISDAQSVTSLQPASPKHHKNKRWR